MNQAIATYLFECIALSNLINVELACNPSSKGEVTKEMCVVIEFAKVTPTTASKVWGWYRAVWQGDFESFLQTMIKAQRYAQAEGLDFEMVAYERMVLWER